MRELSEINESGELAAMNLGGTEEGDQVLKVDDVAPVINTVSQGLDPLAGYAQPNDRVLVHDTSDGKLKSAYEHQIPGVFEMVIVASNLGTVLSRAEFDAAIPNPAVGRQYLILDANDHAFHCTYDGTEVWFERMTKAN